jgi:glycyl-tRNA synthetase beta chain
LDKHNFLLELGCEELPERQLEIACETLESSFKSFLTSNNLACDSFFVSGTPRRVYLNANDLDNGQADIEIQKTGPAVNIAYSADGALSPAGLGFIRKCGATENDCFIQDTDKGRFLAVRFIQKGRTTKELLSGWAVSFPSQIPYTKKMIWDKQSFAYSRPLRWVLALWDTEVLEIEIGGILSGNISYGNRYLGLDTRLNISSAEDYLAILSENKVLANAQQRRHSIESQLASILSGTGLEVVEDQRLVDTVTNLVESPHAVVGEFDEKYLSLPEKIIISTISQNQKYFSVRSINGDKALSNKFVFISNGDPAYSEVIKLGNQKVVNARLADAMWYYNEDTKHKLESYVPKLNDVVFQSKLGTMADKTKRIINLCQYISQKISLDEVTARKVLRCAALCKADLVTTMLGEKEFTKLQGYIGMKYALASGEDNEVAEGIYEHYMPRGSSDGLPQTLCGSVVAVADKMDTVAGIIAIGMMPTGSGDPFALRRAANGIVQIISERAWDIDIFELANIALDGLEGNPNLQAKSHANVHTFMEQRVEWLLKQQKFDYDIIESVMHLNKTKISDLEKRAEALSSLRSEPEFQKLVTGFKRVANIIADTRVFSELDVTKLHEPAEISAQVKLLELHDKLDNALDKKDYQTALQHLIQFGAVIDAFFDSILVNSEDEVIKQNRHSLLNDVKKEFLRMADLSRIVLESEI